MTAAVAAVSLVFSLASIDSFVLRIVEPLSFTNNYERNCFRYRNDRFKIFR